MPDAPETPAAPAAPAAPDSPVPPDSAAERPKIRLLEAVPTARGRRFRLFDPRGVSDRTMEVSPDVLFAILHLDGSRTTAEIAELYRQRFSRKLLDEELREIMTALEECLFLEGPAFQQHVRQLIERYRSGGVRRAAHAGGAYAADGRDLGKQLERLFTAGEAAPGLPDRARKLAPLKGLIAPHIDPQRGGATYAHAYQALAESHPPAETFVVLGTAHAGSGAAYTATELDFETPLGVLPTDRDFLARLARGYGAARLYGDELTHATEHSVEFQAVFLRWLYPEAKELKLVPLLCGSLSGLYEAGTSPADDPDHRDFLSALRGALAEHARAGRRVTLVAGADLSHIGARFGHADPVTPRLQRKMERADHQMLALAERLDAPGFFKFIRDEDDRRNICGAASIYTLLATAGAKSAELLHYGQAVESDEEGPNAVVTFCAMAFR